MTSLDATTTEPERTEDTSETAALYRDLVRVFRTLRTAGSSDDLTAGLSSALWTVINHGPLRLSTLADIESVGMPTASRVVANLEQRGLVERTVDPDDGRARLLQATTAGIAVINHASSAKSRLLSEAIAALDPSTREHLAPTIAALADALCSRDAPGPEPAD
ncbi:MarR family transcriptional regulator [Gordonia sp. GONU]|uniref:MarR family winged helix-turn-helix transcriptional regulator n=1 Tax=Gordonia TaxID=2053 RepID=UPI000407F03E|nr:MULTISPECIES: MarR family transcriptional regulator [Gordonia]MCR8897378.1 MarR family transcriptional regulator [Gordonia sp. GONU]MCZ0914176.1 MarR family transcriptional regulator [Gordonia amicalis]MCZ4652841.1 MarR family transcriptional regulator [Gordonia amicalis]